VAELLVLVGERAALDLAVQRGAADPGREVAPVRAGHDGAGGAVRAGGGDPEAGGDQSVAGLDHPRVSVGGAGLDDHDGAGGPGGRVDEGRSVRLRQFVEDVGEIGRAQSELQSRENIVCRLLLEKKKKNNNKKFYKSKSDNTTNRKNDK